ncbi:MAG: hypothetical protein COS84_04400, partial [Armatimonadetes bacterium CG07_land_8_20_14_0_80_40_9]
LLHSAYEPKKEAERLIESYDLKDKKIIVVLGLGLGYHLEELIEKVPEDTHIWVVEVRKDIFKAYLQSFDLGKALSFKNLQFFVGKIEFISLLTYIQGFFQPKNFGLGQLLIINHSPSFQLDSSYYQDFSKQLRDSIYFHLICANTNIAISCNWAKNSWENILEVLKNPPVKNLFGKFKDKPAIVVSGGPSLDKDIDKLSWAKGKTVLICLGTTFRPLLKKGIIPDLVVAIDSGPLHIKYFEGIEE